MLHPGSKLPPERELAKQFGVNRASIRQALKALDVMGIVHQRVGDGTYLTNDASTTLRAPLDFLILVTGSPFRSYSKRGGSSSRNWRRGRRSAGPTTM